MVYIYNGILFSHKKEGNPAFCDNTVGPWGHKPSEISQRKDKCCMFSLIYGI